MSEKTLAELVAMSVDQYSKELMTLEHSDERIDKMLKYMQLQLSHGEMHPLSRFWKMRKFCLDNFKETISVSKRLRLWEKYRQVIDEIMKLKEMMDEKSAFEKVQIEEALESIQKNVENINSIIANEEEVFVPKCSCLQKNSSFYKSSQKALNVYSLYAKRLNDLKKEILGLDISFKKKQEILDQIHKLGDLIFPTKRDLLTEVSKKYTEDVKFFVKCHFSSEDFKTPLFNLKDQIKQLQSFAKVISLNVEAFSQTRNLLSECWDKLKNFESQQKKIKDEKKQLFDQNFHKIKKKIENLKVKKEQLEVDAFKKELKEINHEIQEEELLKFQRKQLEDELNLIGENRASLSKGSEDPLSLSYAQKEIQKVKENAKYWDYQTLDSHLKVFIEQLPHLKILDSEQMHIQRELFSLKEALASKLIDEIKDRIDVEEISSQIENFKKSLKQDMDDYRKKLGTSNQSIEKAIAYNELVMQTKALLASLEKKLKSYNAQA